MPCRFPGFRSSACSAWIAFLLLLTSVLGLTLAPSCATHAYDRSAACQYAMKYWHSVCSDGHFFERRDAPTYLGRGKKVPQGNEGYDCAHFVSCCIGNEPHELGGGLNIESRTQAYGEPGAARLVAWLIEHGATLKESVSELLPGDVIAYDPNADGLIDHVALYLGNNQVAAHSRSWYGDWRITHSSGFTFVHMPNGQISLLNPTAAALWTLLAVGFVSIAVLLLTTAALRL